MDISSILGTALKELHPVFIGKLLSFLKGHLPLMIGHVTFVPN